MQYNTTLTGKFDIVPALNAQEIEYLNHFNTLTQVSKNNDKFPESSSQWMVSEDGKSISWNKKDDFYEAAQWMQYLLDNIIGRNPKVKKLLGHEVSFIQNHTLNGEVQSVEENWSMIVVNNKITILYPDPDDEEVA